jgi:hypothetical protein
MARHVAGMHAGVSASRLRGMRLAYARQDSGAMQRVVLTVDSERLLLLLLSHHSGTSVAPTCRLALLVTSVGRSLDSHLARGFLPSYMIYYVSPYGKGSETKRKRDKYLS